MIVHKLPDIIDPEGNAEPLVFLDYNKVEYGEFPPFLTFDDATNTLIINPVSWEVMGRTYFFSINLYDRASDTIDQTVNANISVGGD